MPDPKSPTAGHRRDSGQSGFDDPGAAERDNDLPISPERGPRERVEDDATQDPDFDPVYDDKASGRS
ncbi:MAG: hypothetical protein CMN72_01085 [Sphingomonas sp.]|nr:hypothetical protein [Sphingomonas sp.]